ncbi:MAG: hypothetical protein J0H43_10330 [Actinobacteria bacterium]|nr:hypothetical protein [Actinomycetota bacterium]
MSAVWLAGLVAGFFGLLGATTRYGCADTDHSFACRTAGSVVGLLIVVAVVVVVAAVTLMTGNSSMRRIAVIGGSGLVVLALCIVAGQLLLAAD